jgi:flagellar biogenesis protein FliO
MHSPQTDSLVQTPTTWFARCFASVRTFFLSLRIHRRERSLRLCETLPLGEKRLLAVVQFEGRRFLIGATNQSVCLLDRLDSNPTPRQKRESSLDSPFVNGVH